MIRNQWYAILESDKVRRGKPVGMTRMGEKLVAWRDSRGKVTVMHDLCPHRGVALSVGEVHGDCIWCPCRILIASSSSPVQRAAAGGIPRWEAPVGEFWNVC